MKRLRQPVESTECQKYPGANATEKAEEKATKQANDDKGNKSNGKREHFKGTVTAADSGSLTLSLSDSSSVVIGLTANTSLKFLTRHSMAWTCLLRRLQSWHPCQW